MRYHYTPIFNERAEFLLRSRACGHYSFFTILVGVELHVGAARIRISPPVIN